MPELIRALVRILLRSIAKIEVRGAENIPTQGAFIVASNHIGILDILMFFYVSDRLDMFIPVAEKWGKVWWHRWLGKHLNFIFIDRLQPDIKTLRLMIQKMEAGSALVIAPEGTRSRSGTMIAGKPGVAYLAAKSGFPVIPVAITGTEDKVMYAHLRRLRRFPVTLTAGEPFRLPPLPAKGREAALQAHLDEIMCRIAALLPERYRGVYADCLTREDKKAPPPAGEGLG